MKILFVCSGNSSYEISPIIKNQGDSLTNMGLEIDYFPIKGKGLKGYLSNIKPLRALMRKNKYDIVHAHYSLSAFVASFAGAKRLVVSLMGNDVKSNIIFNKYTSIFNKIIIKCFFICFSWKAVIVKSEDMRNNLGIKNIDIIPNGVNLSRFIPIDKNDCQNRLNWNTSKKHILFASNPDRYEKNFPLTQNAVRLLNNDDIEMHFLKDIPNEKTSIWYNAADMVILPSFFEGSPNAIKEAMACCRPIVATDVGDIRWLLGEEPGHYITSFEVDDCAKQIQKALEFSAICGKTNGRQRIMELGLDSATVARKIVEIYNRVLNRQQ